MNLKVSVLVYPMRGHKFCMKYCLCVSNNMYVYVCVCVCVCFRGRVYVYICRMLRIICTKLQGVILSF